VELAEYREREARLAEHEDEGDQVEEQPEDVPDDVPSKATITVKEIRSNWGINDPCNQASRNFDSEVGVDVGI